MDGPLRLRGEVVQRAPRLGVVLRGVVEMLAARVRTQLGEQRPYRLRDTADERHLDRRASPDPLAPDVDLDDRGVRIELLIRQVGPQNQKGLGGHHGAVARGEPEQAGHPHVVGIVVLHPFLAAHRVDDRRLERLRDLQQFVMGARAAGAGEDRHVLAAVEDTGGASEILLGRDHRTGGGADGGHLGGDLLERHVTGQDEHGHPAPLDGRTHRDPQQPRRLLGRRDMLHVDAALAEQFLRMGLLEVARPDLLRRDVRGQREDRDPGALGVEQAVDQVQVARATGAGADGEVPRQRGLRGGGERGRLLVPGDHPIHAVDLADGVSDAVERVAG